MNYRATRWEEKIGINELEIIIMNSMNFEILLWKLWYVIEKERCCKPVSTKLVIFMLETNIFYYS